VKATVDALILSGCALSCCVVAALLFYEDLVDRPLLPKVSARHLSVVNLVFNAAATLYFMLW
jgi:hypothetical protein